MNNRTVRYVLALIAVCALVGSMTTVRHRVVSASPYIDFNLYYFGAVVEKHGSYTDDRAVLAKEKAYTPKEYSQDGVLGAPALIAFVYTPLTDLSVKHAHLVWDIGVAVLMFLAVRMAAQKYWPFYLVALLATGSTLSALQYGNAATLTFVLITFAYAALRNNRKTLFAIALGLAIAFKVYPVFLLVALLPGRHWRWIIETLAVAFIGHVAAIPVLGFNGWLRGTHRIVTLTQGHHIWPDNGSAPGVVEFISGSHGAAIAVSAILIVVSIALILKVKFQRAEQAFAFAAVATLIAQPISWPFYFMLVLLLMIRFVESQPSRIIQISAWVLFFMSTMLSTTLRDAPSWYAPGMPKLIALLILMVLFVQTFRAQSTSTPA